MSALPFPQLEGTCRFTRLRYLLRRRLEYGLNEAAELDDPELPRYIRITDITANGEIRSDTFKSVPEDVARGNLLEGGDILFARSGATVGKTVLFRREWGRATFAGYLIRADANRSELLPEFLIYWTASTWYWHWLMSSATQATIQNVAADRYADLPVPVWPIEVERAIADYLDRETAKIDTLIAKQERLIELLQEKRQALISYAVTKGLNPDAAMKASGAEWFGDVPEHWKVKPVRLFAHVGNGSTPDRDNPAYWEDGNYPWLNSSVVNQEAVTEAQQFVTPLALRECHLPKIVPPAVLIGITGQGRTRGMASTLLIEATINQHVAYLKPHPHEADVGFLRRVFDMAYPYLRMESDGGGSTKGAITCEQIAHLKIPIPPLTEQVAIATHLDSVTANIDGLAAKVTSAIALLREYRSALISAAVTGQLDLRQHEAQLEALA